MFVSYFINIVLLGERVQAAPYTVPPTEKEKEMAATIKRQEEELRLFREEFMKRKEQEKTVTGSL